MNFPKASIKLGLTFAVLAFPAVAQGTFQPIQLAGTVLAYNMTGLSYGASGCIKGFSQTSTKTGFAAEGEVLVELDDRAAALVVKTAKARVSDLEAAVAERDFAITAATADVARIKEEMDFVGREFDRTQVLFKRGLVNETTLETIERRKLDATFTVERSEETLKRAQSAKARAIIALEIGTLDVQARELDLEDLTIRAPFGGVLLNFKPNIGECVSQGELAAQIYASDEKSVETFVVMDRLLDAESIGVVVGNPVNVMRSNGSACPGVFSLVGTEANLETQNVKITIDLDATCAPKMFLNEAVEIETLSKDR